METKSHYLFIVLALLALATLNAPLATAHAQGTAFTYQGRVTDNGTNFTGTVTASIFNGSGASLTSLNAANLSPAHHFTAGYANLPISFEANIGQADSAIEFLAHGHNGNLFLTRGEAWLTLQKNGNQNEPPRVIRFKLSGANSNPELQGLDQLPGKANYFAGNDSSRWRTDVPTFAKVKYHDVYAGVDLIYYGTQQKLEYDFVVYPGANPNVIALAFTGVEKISLDANGDLLLHLPGDSVRQHKPIVYQEIGGARKMLSGNYVLHSAMQVGFQVADYDQTKPLIIDPVLSYSATFGGSGLNQALAIAVDAQANVYVTGNTTSTDFPTVNAFQTNYLGDQDVFVTKFDTNGAIVYSTFLGGGILNNINTGSSGQGIAVDGNGDAFVTGYTQATNFPTARALFSTNSGGYDAFVTELNPAGNALVYSTYLGGSGFDAANAIALDTNGVVLITGNTQSTNFPTANAAQPVYGGNGDAFVAKLSAGGSALVYSTYLGGDNSENNVSADLLRFPAEVAANFGGALAVDFAGNAFVTGWTYSTNFPVLNAFQPTNALDASYSYGISCAAFVTEFDPSGNLVYSTYFGGVYNDFGRAIGVDFNDNVYFAGNDSSGGLSLLTTNAFQPRFGGDGDGYEIGDGFIAALDSTGTNLIYCTYLGGSGDDQINGIAVRPEDGSVAVTGFTDSLNFPVLDAVQPAGDQGLFKSSDGASTWNLSNSGLASGRIYAIQIDPSNPSVIYALALAANGYSENILKSTNSGGAWTSMSSGLGSPPLAAEFAVDPLHPGTLYVGGYSAVYKTTNGAANWTAASTGFPASTSIKAVTVDPTTPTTLYAGTEQSGIYKSTDAGNTWNAINTGLNSMFVTALLVDPQNSSNVYAGVGDSSFTANLFKSTNGGVSWTALSNGLALGDVTAMAFNPANSSMIYAVVATSITDTLCLSTNGGVSWSAPLEAFGFQFTALAVTAPAAPAVTIARSDNNDNVSWPASFTGYTLQSTPSLSPPNWQNVSQPPATTNGNNVVPVPMSGAQGYYRLLRTNNASSSPPTLYLGTGAASGQGLLQSTDGGNFWNAVGFAGDTISALAVNPANPAIIYAGLDGGRDAFLATLTPDGQLYSSTYLGGSGADQGNAVAVDFTTVYVAGSTSSSDFPTTAAPSLVHQSKIKPDGVTPKIEITDGAVHLTRTIFVVVKGALQCPTGENKTITVNVNQSLKFQYGIDRLSSHDIVDLTGAPPVGTTIETNIADDWVNFYGTPTMTGEYSFSLNYTNIDEKGNSCHWTDTFTIIVQ